MNLEALLIPEITNTVAGFGIGFYIGYRSSKYYEIKEITDKLGVFIKADEELGNVKQKESSEFQELYNKIKDKIKETDQSKNLNHLLDCFTAGAGITATIPATIYNLIRGHSFPQFMRCWSFALLAGLAGGFLGRYIGKKKREKRYVHLDKKIEDLFGRIKKAIIENNDKEALTYECAGYLSDRVSISGFPEWVLAYYTKKLDDAVDYATAYRDVKIFMRNIDMPFQATSIFGEAKHDKGYIILIEDGQLVTADVEINFMRVLKTEESLIGTSAPIIKVNKPVKWDGDIDAVVNTIRKNRGDHTIVLATGGKKQPMVAKMSLAAGDFLMSHYEWTQKERKKNYENN